MTAYRRFAQQVYDWNSRLGPNADPTPFQSCLLLSAMQLLNLLCLAKVLPLPAALDPFGTTMGFLLAVAFLRD